MRMEGCAGSWRADEPDHIVCVQRCGKEHWVARRRREKAAALGSPALFAIGGVLPLEDIERLSCHAVLARALRHELAEVVGEGVRNVAVASALHHVVREPGEAALPPRALDEPLARELCALRARLLALAQPRLCLLAAADDDGLLVAERRGEVGAVQRLVVVGVDDRHAAVAVGHLRLRQPAALACLRPAIRRRLQERRRGGVRDAAPAALAGLQRHGAPEEAVGAPPVPRPIWVQGGGRTARARHAGRRVADALRSVAGLELQERTEHQHQQSAGREERHDAVHFPGLCKSASSPDAQI